MKEYHINVFYDEDDDCYIADIPDLRVCSAGGSTPEGALQEVLVAKELWLEAAEARGIPIPEPQYRPASYELADAVVAPEAARTA